MNLLVCGVLNVLSLHDIVQADTNTRTFDYKIKGYHVIPAHKMVPNTSSDQVETIVINIRVLHKIYMATKALCQSANKISTS